MDLRGGTMRKPGCRWRLRRTLVGIVSVKLKRPRGFVYGFVWLLVALALISTMVLWQSIEGHFGVERSDVPLNLAPLFSGLPRNIDLVSEPRPTVSVLSKDITYGRADDVCPENDFAGTDRNVTLYMNWTDPYHVDQKILRTHTNTVRNYLRKDNAAVQSVYSKQAHRKQPQGTVSEALSEGILMNDYYYVSGGHWIPATCRPRWKVALIVPFRDRFYQLPIFLQNIVPFLKRQNLEFGIYVIEQANELKFNRAMLLNVGFQQALNFSRWDCFIFHDVDHLPLNDANYYGCSHMPRHFIVGADRWGYKVRYKSFFGAVTGFTRSQIQKFNGFSNAYWGWGSEDDDSLIRIRSKGFFKSQPLGVTGLYNVIAEHHKSAPKNDKRACLLKHARQRLQTDGLNNLVYPPVRVTLNALYTFISVNITKLPWNPAWKDCGPK